MPMFWEYPGKDGNFWNKESESVQQPSPDAGDHEEANITVDIMIPVKNMQLLRETVSELEMLTRAGN